MREIAPSEDRYPAHLDITPYDGNMDTPDTYLEAYRGARKTAERMAADAGIAARLAEGATLGPAPLGYRNVRQDGRTWVELDPVKAPLVREAFELAATGRYSLRKLSALMFGKRLTSRHGLPLSAPALKHILSNPYYAGTIVRNGEATQGSHPAIVTEELFDAVQAALKARSN